MWTDGREIHAYRLIILCHFLLGVQVPFSAGFFLSDSANHHSGTTDDVTEYCLAETFRARCPHGDVISMTKAFFGRMRVGRCITSDAFQLQHPDSLGCSADVLGYFDRVCSGKSACDVIVPNPDLLSYRPCSAHLTTYLEASYSCVSVVDEDRSCSIATVVGSSTFISSYSEDQQRNRDTSNAHCGSRTNPWIVEAQMGQQINVTLLDFGRRHDDVTNGDTLSVDRADRKLGGCAIQYGYIMDQSAVVNKNTTICATANESQRSRFVYQSTGSRVEIVLAAAQAEYGSKQNKFLLGFEAVGCSNLVPPTDAWLRRTDNEATVGCYTTRQRWQLRCIGGQWKGALGLCSENEIIEANSDVFSAIALTEEKKTFFNLLVIVAVSFSGLAVCLIIIFVGICCCRRYQQQLNLMKAGQYPSIDPFTQVQKTLFSGRQTISDHETTRSADVRHQYFILDKDVTGNEGVSNTSA